MEDLCSSLEGEGGRQGVGVVLLSVFFQNLIELEWSLKVRSVLGSICGLHECFVCPDF